MVVLIVFWGVNTHGRNTIWASELGLCQDSYAKAPNNGRAASNLASQYLNGNNTERALKLLKKAYSLPQSTKNYSEAVSLNGQGFVYNKLGDIHKAEILFKKSLEFVPDYTEARMNLIYTYLKLNQLQNALDNTNLINLTTNIQNILLKENILLRLNKPDEALKLLARVPRKFILSIDVMQGIGKAMSMLGMYKRADFFLAQVARFGPFFALCRIENLLLAQDYKEADTATDTLFSSFSAQEIFNLVTTDDPLNSPLNREILYPFIMGYAHKIMQTKSQAQ